jgi:hypothetical protein
MAPRARKVSACLASVCEDTPGLACVALFRYIFKTRVPWRPPFVRQRPRADGQRRPVSGPAGLQAAPAAPAARLLHGARALGPPASRLPTRARQVGGDGLFQEVLNGALAVRRAGGAAGAAAERLRLGHIPAGSTDAVACSLHGTRSAATAALHIALGDRRAPCRAASAPGPDSRP